MLWASELSEAASEGARRATNSVAAELELIAGLVLAGL